MEISTNLVLTRQSLPAHQPVGTFSKIAILGDSPGKQEVAYRIPFCGTAGNFLSSILYAQGVSRDSCYLSYVVPSQLPPAGFASVAWTGREVTEGGALAVAEVAALGPNILLCLGSAALNFAMFGQEHPPKSRGKSLSWKADLRGWRGSLFYSPTFQCKAISTYDPFYVLRDYSTFPLLQFDLQRTVTESRNPELTLPIRTIHTSASANELCYLMDTWGAGVYCSLDIEGGLPRWLVNDKVIAKPKKTDRLRYGWPCVSLSPDPARAWSIAWGRYSEVDHCRLLRSFAKLMYREDVPKVLQNQLYDNFVLSFGYGIPIRNVTQDTMIKGWAMYAELPRGLSTQASIWTRQPHWKDENMYGSSIDNLAHGCGMDSAVTLEICLAQETALSSESRKHYRTMMDLQNCFLFMELYGIKYDQEAVSAKLVGVQVELDSLGTLLDTAASMSLRGPKGALSSTRLCTYLYGPGGYPPQYAKVAGRLTTKLTSDKDALLKLKKLHSNDPFLTNILRHRHLEGVRETLSIVADGDGRVRCGYSLEAETGRVKCYSSPTGSGANLQTIQKELRFSYTAESPGHDFAQCDLEGADGWTVACRCKALGDSTMFDDYKAGMKPAKIIALLYYFGEVINTLSRPDLVWLHKNVFDIVKDEVGKWLYLGCKRVQHGTNYLMGIPTMQMNVLMDSYKESGIPVYLGFADAKRLQQLYLARYKGVGYWHTWSSAMLTSKGELRSASGHNRVFFGRRNGKELNTTLKEFLANEPQNNTTWATSLAMLKLWTDPENRIGGTVLMNAYDTWQATLGRRPGGLFIVPVHQVHDALCVVWEKLRRDWAKGKMKQYFDNELVIASIPVTIPFEGRYGSSWGEQKNKI